MIYARISIFYSIQIMSYGNKCGYSVVVLDVSVYANHNSTLLSTRLDGCP